MYRRDGRCSAIHGPHQAQNTGVAVSYCMEYSVELRAQFHACLALAFVPVEHVVSAFEKLKDNAVDILDGVIDLLEETYVLGRLRGRGRRARRGAPRYPIATWNVYQRTLEGISRTNNTVEAWNRRLNTVVAKPHPNIFALVDALKSEEDYHRGPPRLR